MLKLDDATVSSSRGSAKADFLELLNNRRMLLMVSIGLLYKYHCTQSWILFVEKEMYLSMLN
jgi:hypothetical protein